MNAGAPIPWQVVEISHNHNHGITDANGVIIARRMRKQDAERIVRAINLMPLIVAKERATAMRLHNAQATVAKLRAYIRDGQASVLRAIRLGIHHESI